MAKLGEELSTKKNVKNKKTKKLLLKLIGFLYCYAFLTKTISKVKKSDESRKLFDSVRRK